MIVRRLITGTCAAMLLTLTTGCLTSQEKVAMDTRDRDLQQRLDDITAQLMTVSEQIEKKTAPAPIRTAGLQPTTPIEVITPLPSRSEQLLAIKHAQRPVVRQHRRRPRHSRRYSRRSSRGHLSQQALVRKHIRVPQTVRTIQGLLQAANTNPGKIDGRLGDNTIAAIRRFQKKNRLKVDGIVGRGTWKALRSYASAGRGRDTSKSVNW